MLDYTIAPQRTCDKNRRPCPLKIVPTSDTIYIHNFSGKIYFEVFSINTQEANAQKIQIK